MRAQEILVGEVGAGTLPLAREMMSVGMFGAILAHHRTQECHLFASEGDNPGLVELGEGLDSTKGPPACLAEVPP